MPPNKYSEMGSGHWMSLCDDHSRTWESELDEMTGVEAGVEQCKYLSGGGGGERGGIEYLGGEKHVGD